MQVSIKEIHEELSLTGVTIGDKPFKNINKMETRAAMGLASFQSGDQYQDPEEIQKLAKMSPSDLASLLENCQISFNIRWMAGKLLNCYGDPRIKPLQPQMIEIPAAEGLIGISASTIDEVVSEFQHYGVLAEWIEKETPQHKVNINAYRLAKYCVTNKEYEAFLLDSHEEEIPSSWLFGIFPEHLANHPVYGISVESAEAYIAWLNQKTGRSYRLPREEEWEYAAKGDDKRTYPWGEHYSADHANTVEGGIVTTSPVGLFPKGNGPFGHADLAGNVEEYLSNDYGPYPGAEIIADDLLITRKQYRVARGGSFTRFRDLARTTRRHGWYESELYVMGFRLAEDNLEH